MESALSRSGHSNKRCRDVWGKTDGHCAYCGREIDPEENWQMEHVVPRALGGGEGISNLVLSCHFCNAEKKNKTPDRYREYIVLKMQETIATLAFRAALYAQAYDDGFNLTARHLQKAKDAMDNVSVEFYFEAKSSQE